MIRFPTNGNLDRSLSRWWAWLASKGPKIDDRLEIHSIDYHYCTAGPQYARNQIIDKFIQTDCTHLWMIDRDVSPPQHLGLLAAALNQDGLLFSGVYDSYHTEKQVGFPQVYKHLGGTTWQTVPKISWPKAPVFKADGVGAGCLLLRRDLVTEKMTPPWFEFRHDERGSLVVGEDLVFCEKAGGVYVVPSYQCAHYKEVSMEVLREITESRFADKLEGNP